MWDTMFYSPLYNVHNYIENQGYIKSNEKTFGFAY